MTFFVGKKKRRATDKEPVSVRSGRLFCGFERKCAWSGGNKKRVPSNDETLFKENG
jgi:hypothetical protein